MKIKSDARTLPGVRTEIRARAGIFSGRDVLQLHVVDPACSCVVAVVPAVHNVAVCFFFSSRRRHTRYWRDWSSDVCSSDLAAPAHLRTHQDPHAKAAPGG